MMRMFLEYFVNNITLRVVLLFVGFFFVDRNSTCLGLFLIQYWYKRYHSWNSKLPKCTFHSEKLNLKNSPSRFQRLCVRLFSLIEVYMFIYFEVFFFDSFIKSQEINFGLLHTNLSTPLVEYLSAPCFRSRLIIYIVWNVCHCVCEVHALYLGVKIFSCFFSVQNSK